MTALKACEAIELRQSLIKPGGQPSEIEVKQAVYVLVIDDPESIGIDTIGIYYIEADQCILLFPSMEIHAGGLGSAVLPELWHQFPGAGLILGCQNQ